MKLYFPQLVSLDTGYKIVLFVSFSLRSEPMCFYICIHVCFWFFDMNCIFIRPFEKTGRIMGTRAAVGRRPEHLPAQ